MTYVLECSTLLYFSLHPPSRFAVFFLILISNRTVILRIGALSLERVPLSRLEPCCWACPFLSCTPLMIKHFSRKSRLSQGGDEGIFHHSYRCPHLVFCTSLILMADINRIVFSVLPFSGTSRCGALFPFARRMRAAASSSQHTR